MVDEPGCSPHRRRYILVATTEQVDNARRSGDFEIASRSDVKVLDYDGGLQDALVASLDRCALLFPGAFLAQSPYDRDQYYLADEFEARICEQRFSFIQQLGSILGAVQVNAVESRNETRGRTAGVIASASPPKKPAGSVEIRGESSGVDKGTWTWRFEYSGSDPDIKSARELLARTGLDADPVLNSLVQTVSNTANPVEMIRIEVDLLREARRSMKVLAGLTVPQFVCSFDATASTEQVQATKRIVEMVFKNPSRTSAGSSTPNLGD